MPPDNRPDGAKKGLNRSQVLSAAVGLADSVGIDKFTIRKLAAELDVKPMTIYYHVANKEAIMDGMVDLLFGEIEVPSPEDHWKNAMRHRSRSVRSVLASRAWAVPLMESRTAPGPATLRHHDGVLGCLRRGGFSIEMTAHAYALIDSYVYGFVLQEANLPATGGDAMAELAEQIIEPMPEGEYPFLMELTAEHILKPGYDFGDEFDFGLDLILDGLDALRLADSGS